MTLIPWGLAFLFALLSRPVAHAYQEDRNICERDAEAARQSCESKALHAGFSEGESNQALALTEKIKRINDNVRNLRINQSAQCDNQKDLSNYLAEMAARKAMACIKAIDSCDNVCSFERDVYATEEEALSLVGSREGREKKRKLKDKRNEAIATCQSHRSRAQQALEQARSSMDGAQMNAACAVNTSVQKTAQLPDGQGNKSGTENRSSGCIGPDGKMLDSCRKFHAVAEDSERNSGRFRPAGFSDAQWENRGGGGESESRFAPSAIAASHGGGSSRGGTVGRGRPTLGGAHGQHSMARAPAGFGAPAEQADGAENRRRDGLGAFEGSSAMRGSDGSGADPEKAESRSNLAGRRARERNGITGAFGPTIFQKVSRRYQLERPTLLDE